MVTFILLLFADYVGMFKNPCDGDSDGDGDGVRERSVVVWCGA